MRERKRRDWPVIGGAIALLALALVYASKEDGMAAVTIWPFWVPLFLCLLPATVSFRKANWKPRAVLLLASLLVLLAVGEEMQSLGRSLIPASVHNLRVVSLNCAGTAESAMEVVALKPDIVLLQESMGTDDIESVRAKLGADWSKVVGVDASILARGELRAVELPQGTTNYVAAWLGETLVVSLRLQPPVFRMDYWNPACWRAYADKKRARRAELLALVEAVGLIAKLKPTIMGGDFNTPPDGTITESLTYSALYDAFALAGRGWGATAVNDFPMVRIDQIWASEEFDPVNAYSKKTRHSDHQMAVAEFSLRHPNR